MRPDARRDRLLLEEVGEEVVVYDLQHHRAHRLNHTAALVWRSCDGRKTVADLRKVLRHELNPAADEAIVWKALDRLGKAQLLRLPRASAAAGMTRRQALGKFARGAALAFLVPVVTSIIAPTPLWAGDRDFACDEPPCKNACKDKCKRDKDCPKSNPLCKLLSCNNSNCPCMQKRCTKQKTAHEINP